MEEWVHFFIDCLDGLCLDLLDNLRNDCRFDKRNQDTCDLADSTSCELNVHMVWIHINSGLRQIKLWSHFICGSSRLLADIYFKIKLGFSDGNIGMTFNCEELMECEISINDNGTLSISKFDSIDSIYKGYLDRRVACRWRCSNFGIGELNRATAYIRKL